MLFLRFIIDQLKFQALELISLFIVDQLLIRQSLMDYPKRGCYGCLNGFRRSIKGNCCFKSTLHLNELFASHTSQPLLCCDRRVRSFKLVSIVRHQNVSAQIFFRFLQLQYKCITVRHIQYLTRFAGQHHYEVDNTYEFMFYSSIVQVINGAQEAPNIHAIGLDLLQ